MPETTDVGQRLRELRSWRKLNMRTAAQLSGISFGYLGQIERGERPIESRQTLEALAMTLRVSPADLTSTPWTRTDPDVRDAQATLLAIEAALTEWWPGEIPDGPRREWGAVAKDIAHLLEVLRPTSDYTGQGAVIPGLIRDLLTYAVSDEHRRPALRALISVYHAAGNLAARLGTRHLGYVASERVTQAAQLLDEPEWLGVAAWTRAQFVSSISRPRQYSLAVAGADAPGARLESRGMSHLTAALAAASQGLGDTARDHLAEAARMADALDLDNSSWGGGTMNFGRANVGIWQVSITVESGDGGKVSEIARDVAWQAVPTSRQGAFWMDVGRGLITSRRSQRRERGLSAMLRAEQLTPQQVRSNNFARDAVASALAAAKRDAGGVELRGLAWRMGIAPTG